jgi:HTH-type transcriptional regulator/antitoxin HipB
VDYAIKTLNQLRPILKGFRKSEGLTQAVMASHLGVTQQTYAQLEANPAAISVERLFRVLRVLNVDLTLTQRAGGLPKKVGVETIVPPSPRRVATAEQVPGADAARRDTAAATGRGKPKAQHAQKKSAPGMVSSDQARAKPGRGTFVKERRADVAAVTRRGAGKTGVVSKKRENW